MLADVGIHHHAHAEVLSATIASRIFRLAGGTYGRFHHLFLLSDGLARLGAGETGEARGLAAPCLVYLPAGSFSTVLVEAGSAGILVGVSPELMADAIGDKAESFAIRIFSEHPHFEEQVSASRLAETAPLFSGFARELREPERESWMAVSAYLRLALTVMSRRGATPEIRHAGQGETSSILQRYRQLVEVNFRRHWPIALYARELGITTDRLHAVCQRVLSRSPIRLLHERLVHEARLRLERSAGTVRQISDELGFRDPTYFSHFFKRRTGLSPAEFRRKARSAAGGARDAITPTFADWP